MNLLPLLLYHFYFSLSEIVTGNVFREKSSLLKILLSTGNIYFEENTIWKIRLNKMEKLNLETRFYDRYNHISYLFVYFTLTQLCVIFLVKIKQIIY